MGGVVGLDNKNVSPTLALISKQSICLCVATLKKKSTDVNLQALEDKGC